MKRLHLVTSRAPLARSVGHDDALVFLDTNVSTTFKAQVRAQCRSEVHEIERLGYNGLVRLVARYDSVVSW